MATQEVRSRTAVEDEGLATQVQQQVQDKAEDLKAQASGKLREQLDTRSTEAGDQFGSLAAALRKAASELESDGKRPRRAWLARRPVRSSASAAISARATRMRS